MGDKSSSEDVTIVKTSGSSNEPLAYASKAVKRKHRLDLKIVYLKGLLTYFFI